MTRFHLDIPTESEICDAVAELFERAMRNGGTGLLSALIPVDTTMHEGHQVLSYVFDYEMAELCNFVKYFDGLIEREAHVSSRGRMQVLVYCHIFEADYPLTTIWNLHRLLEGREISWTFSRMTRKGETEVLKYPKDRVSELERLSNNLGIVLGSMLASLWQNDLRNAFSHSQYFWTGDILSCTGRLSPNIRKGIGVGSGGSKSFASSDLAALYAGALC